MKKPCFFHAIVWLIVTLVFVSAQFGNVFERHGCPDGWLEFESSCYMFGDTVSLDWTESTHFCAAHFGSNLAVIDSLAEELFLKDFCRRLSKKDLSAVFWLGATDDEIEGVWTWYTDHRRVDAGYHTWYPGEPDNVNDQDCACLQSYFNFSMGDGHCDYKEHFICEKNVSALETVDIIG